MDAILGFTGPPDAELRRRMGDLIVHRGQEEIAFRETPFGTLVYRGHGRRFPAGGLARDRERTLVLAGRLNGDAHTPSDVLAAYRRRGLESLHALRGSFVLALLDGETCHLLRDGAGRRTIYHARRGDRVLFSIEPKGLHQLPGFTRRLRAGAVAEYLTFSFIPGERTMLEGMSEVPAGHRVRIGERGALADHRWFRPEQAGDEEQRTERAWVEEFQDQFARAISEERAGPEPYAVLLSGGIDSSIVTAELARQSAAPPRSFAIHFGENYPNELEFAHAVAARCGTRHRDVLIQPRDFLRRLRDIVWCLDEPVGDPVAMPNFELARIIGRDFSFAFNGEGGDPVFGGPKNLPMLLRHWYGHELGPNFRERAYLASYRRGYEELARLLTPEFREQIDENELEDILTPFFVARRPRSFVGKLMAINMRLKGAHLILPKVERTMAAGGIVPHSPLFDERLIELSFQLPGRLKLRHGVEKIILKEAFRDRLPRRVIDRPKSGMRVPVHFWLQKEMKRYAREILSPRELRKAGIWNPRRVQQLLDYDTDEGPGRYGLRLWMLITFELWRRRVIDGES